MCNARVDCDLLLCALLLQFGGTILSNLKVVALSFEVLLVGLKPINEACRLVLRTVEQFGHGKDLRERLLPEDGGDEVGLTDTIGLLELRT